MDAMGQGLLVTDSDARLEYVNPTLCELLGVGPTALLGRKVMDIVAEEDRVAIRARRPDRRAGIRSEYEARMIKADGESVPVLLAHVPRMREGDYVGGIVVVTELTLRRNWRTSSTTVRSTIRSRICPTGCCSAHVSRRR
jgi:PAS domain S-box-containing protein